MVPSRSSRDSFVSHGPSRTGSTAGVSALFIAFGALLVPAAIAYSLGTVNEIQVVAGLLAALGIVLIVVRPFFGLSLFVVLLYVRPEETFPALTGMHLTLAIALFALTGMIVHMMVGRVPVVRAPVIGMMIGFGLVVVLSSVPYGTSEMAAEDASRFLVMVLLVLNLVRDEQKYRALVTVTIGCTAYLAIYSAYLYFTGHSLDQSGVARSRLTGIFNDPNDLAGTVVSGLALVYQRMIRSPSWRRIPYVLAAGAMLFSIFLTNSRSGLIALLVVTVASLVLYSKNRKLAVVLAVVAAICFIGAAPSRMREMDSQEESANMRLGLWEEGILDLERNPLTGIGYSEFMQQNTYTAHNSYVLCFAELGFPGYFFWIGTLYFAFRRRPLVEGEEAPSEDAKADLTASRIALAGFLTSAFWISRTYVPVLYMFASMPIAQQVASTGRVVVFPAKPGERWRDCVRIVGVCLGLVVLISLMIRYLA